MRQTWLLPLLFIFAFISGIFVLWTIYTVFTAKVPIDFHNNKASSKSA